MTLSRTLAALAFLAFFIFVGVVLWKVPRLDLSIALLIGLGLAGWDLWTQLGPGRRA